MHHMSLFSRPRQSQGLLYRHLRHSLSDKSFVKISLKRRHAQMVRNGVLSQKHIMFDLLEILNLKGNLNCIIGSKVWVILLNL